MEVDTLRWLGVGINLVGAALVFRAAWHLHRAARRIRQRQQPGAHQPAAPDASGRPAATGTGRATRGG